MLTSLNPDVLNCASHCSCNTAMRTLSAPPGGLTHRAVRNISLDAALLQPHWIMVCKEGQACWVDGRLSRCAWLSLRMFLCGASSACCLFKPTQNVTITSRQKWCGQSAAAHLRAFAASADGQHVAVQEEPLGPLLQARRQGGLQDQQPRARRACAICMYRLGCPKF